MADLKTLRFSWGVTRRDKIRNEYIRGTAQVEQFEDKVREARWRFMDVVPDDMHMTYRQDDIRDWVRWKQIILYGEDYTCIYQKEKKRDF